ncbi:MAG: SEL1-like repeat protein [Muribaculaceae bacterium]|nr:SEL1-like repeat protein [Muribaculaceae bacterium]
MEALYNLAMCYLSGKGVEKDIEKTKQLLKSAADKGDAISERALKRLD